MQVYTHTLTHAHTHTLSLSLSLSLSLKHHRKRLRELCSGELVWRSQANLQLAQCHLDHLLTHRREGEREEEGRTENYCAPLEGDGVIHEGRIPTYLPVIPGSSQGARGTENQDSQSHDKTPGSPSPPLRELAEMMSCLQRAVVLASRGRQWIQLQNAFRGLWNAIHTLLASVAGQGDASYTDSGMDSEFCCGKSHNILTYS